MMEPERISPDLARKKVLSGEALLVCAYSDERCRSLKLEGAIFLSQLEAQPSLAQGKEIIFYCA
ncbi:MAG: ArsR family transcriptional regulator [Hydrogenobacter sp.]|uniref:hypothetical protein n=1 Tax=Hydrogenobacter thermophilus TaxID=940 RepID=UPI0030F7B73D